MRGGGTVTVSPTKADDAIGAPNGRLRERRCHSSLRTLDLSASPFGVSFPSSVNRRPNAPDVLLCCVQVQGVPKRGGVITRGGARITGESRASRSPPHSGHA